MQFANREFDIYQPIKLNFQLTGHLNGGGVYFWST
nr:MAG TPA: hypothetical protein [Caudoviricetes sp.]